MKITEFRKLIREEVRKVIKEVEDLELKSAAKRVFSVAKKYGLEPTYQTKTVNFKSKPKTRDEGYGADVVVADGMLTIGIYDRGVLQSISRGAFPGVDKGEVNNTTNDPHDSSNAKGLNKAMGILFNAFMQQLPGDKFETKNSGSKPNNYGYYLIFARLKASK